MNRRTLFFISDGTGITAENLGSSLISQFEKTKFSQSTIPFVDSVEKAYQAVAAVNEAGLQDGKRPIIISTFVNEEIQTIISTANALIFDVFGTFIGPLEKELNETSLHAVGKRTDKSFDTYDIRMKAINYALRYDDGTTTQGYAQADVILIGVSRCGKTPTCLYLALQFGIWAANYPLTEEDLESSRLPEALKPYKNKLFGLTIDPQRLNEIRTERRPGSRYAEAYQCQREIEAVESIFKNESIPFISTTKRSIEELATKIILATGIQRRLT